MWKKEKEEMTKVKNVVKREIVVHASIEKVWEALTKEEHLNKWYTKEATLDFRVGGKGYLNHGWGATSEGTYTEITPMQRFVLQGNDADFTTITELEVVEDGVKVSITYTASYLDEMDTASKENMLFGTGQFLENLKSVYETGLDNRKNLWQAWVGIVHTTHRESIGTEIIQVQDGSAAAKAGLLPGDIIIGMDNIPVLGYESFERFLNAKSINQPVSIQVLRGTEELELTTNIDPYPVAY
jgi:uncharacterized protein YndB with AHSA1/START domain